MLGEFTYHGLKVAVWATIGGKRFPVNSFASSFRVNTIPSATVVIPVGYDMGAPDTMSPIHTLKLTDVIGETMKVYCKVSSDVPADRAAWSKDPFLLFEGYIVGTNYQRSNNLSFVFHLVHWMLDLNNSNWASCAVDASSSDDLFKNVSFPDFNKIRPDGSRMRTLILATDGIAGTLNGTDAIGKQFWVEVIKPWLVKMANAKLGAPAQQPAALVTALGSALNVNEKAVKALNRMDNAALITVPQTPLFGKGEAWGAHPGIAARFASAIATILFSNVQQPATLWTKLMQLLGLAQFALVPTIETGTVVPWVPTLSAHWKDIRHSEITGINIDTRITTPLRGIIIMSDQDPPWTPPQGTPGGAPADQAKALANMYPAYGAYYVDDEYPEHYFATGVVGVRIAPSWMGRLHLDARATDAAPRAKATRSRVRNKKKVITGDIVKTVVIAYAKSLYLGEVFRERNGSIDTRLRFDIAPGSIIRLRGAADESKNLPGFTNRMMQAAVVGVDTHISADGPSCGSRFELCHVRTADNTDVSADSHPLTGTSWTGSALNSKAGN